MRVETLAMRARIAWASIALVKLQNAESAAEISGMNQLSRCQIAYKTDPSVKFHKLLNFYQKVCK